MFTRLGDAHKRYILRSPLGSFQEQRDAAVIDQAYFFDLLMKNRLTTPFIVSSLRRQVHIQHPVEDRHEIGPKHLKSILAGSCSVEA